MTRLLLALAVFTFVVLLLLPDAEPQPVELVPTVTSLPVR